MGGDQEYMYIWPSYKASGGVMWKGPEERWFYLGRSEVSTYYMYVGSEITIWDFSMWMPAIIIVAVL